MESMGNPIFKEDSSGTTPAVDKVQVASVQMQSNLLLASLTHDMRSPLFAVLGYLNLLQKQLEMQVPGPGLEYARRAQEAGLRLDHMMTETLDLVRFGHQLPSLHMEMVSLQHLFKRLWGTFEIAARERNVRLNVILKGEKDVLIHADPSFLERALDNLVANAIKFSPEGGDVVLTGSEREGRVIFEVSDRGRGIPKEAQPSIFEPYQQVAPSDRSRGFGLGLAIVRYIAKAHRGEIHVASEPGTGTCFTLWIPAGAA